MNWHIRTRATLLIKRVARDVHSRKITENGHSPPGKAEQDGMKVPDDGPKVVGFVVGLTRGFRPRPGYQAATPRISRRRLMPTASPNSPNPAFEGYAMR